VTTITFKSVGEKSTSARLNETPVPTPIGIKTPLRQGHDSDGIFGMHYSLEDQVQDNFRNLLLTNHGDRLGIFDFGANLSPLVFELGSLSEDDFDAEIGSRIQKASSKFMPFLDLKTFETEIDNNDNSNVGKVIININYDVPTLGIKNKRIQVTFFVAG